MAVHIKSNKKQKVKTKRIYFSREKWFLHNIIQRSHQLADTRKNMKK